MAVNGTDTQIDSLMANYFAELVNDRSGGSVTIDSTGGAYYAQILEPKGITYLGSFHNGILRRCFRYGRPGLFQRYSALRI
ncbi:MAG: hypothetical protein HFI29_09400 [Lachnospiraceae bacterium]|jgi:hypothetical protein|nr:hypothetical protein [Lachnospiraceae bacterium]